MLTFDCLHLKLFCESVFGCFFVVQQFIEADHDLLAHIIWPPELLGRVLTSCCAPGYSVDNGKLQQRQSGRVGWGHWVGRMQTGYYGGNQ